MSLISFINKQAIVFESLVVKQCRTTLIFSNAKEKAEEKIVKNLHFFFNKHNCYSTLLDTS